MTIQDSPQQSMLVAALTGDLVGSTQHMPADSKKHVHSALSFLKAALQFVETDVPQNPVPEFDIFRGDGFQGIVEIPKALYVALIIRLHLRLRSAKISPDMQNLDARVAIGIGEIIVSGARVSEHDGSALRRSGPLLDEMKRNETRLRFRTPWNEITTELNTECKLLDALMTRWSTEQDEAILYRVLGMTQEKIAGKVGISQSAVAQRLKRAGASAVEALLERYETLAISSISL